MKASDYIAKRLAEKGVTAVFELVGGMITHLLDSLHTRGEIRIISMHHEQGAAFAAEAAGRIGGVPGVAMATSGPGATNLLTGIGSCYFDSSPAVFITGQVNRHEQKGSRAIRQLGFQETDIVTMAKPVTKWAHLLQDVSELPEVLDRAFEIATTGRPGPVLIDIPMDVQRGEVPEQAPPPNGNATATVTFSEADARAVRDAMLAAERPMILAGGGLRSSRSVPAFRHFVDRAGVPVVHSLMGVDLLPYEHPLHVGMIGSYGNRWANLALTRSDCLVVLGSRLDVRQTGVETAAFKGERPIFHIDCEAGEMNNRVTGCTAHHAELPDALRVLSAVPYSRTEAQEARKGRWLDEIHSLREQWPDTGELPGIEGINPNVFMHQLSRASLDAGAYIIDVGQHQMWAAQSLELHGDQRFLTSGGMGSMGFALPAAIGAAVSLPGRRVIMVAGDGSFQCNIQELQTVARLGLPLHMVVINNQAHGMVRQFQQSYFNERFQSTVWGYSAPDFAKVAHAYGIRSATFDDPAKAESALTWLNEEPKTPALLQVMVSSEANAYPKLAFGRGMESMEPFVKPLEMEGT